jgi:hypothetical protein
LVHFGSFKYSFLRSTENCSRCNGKEEATWKTRRKWQNNIEMGLECIEFECKLNKAEESSLPGRYSVSTFRRIVVPSSLGSIRTRRVTNSSLTLGSVAVLGSCDRLSVSFWKQIVLHGISCFCPSFSPPCGRSFFRPIFKS